MSGLFGMIHSGAEDGATYLQRARAAMSHRPWYMGEDWSAPEAPLVLGRLGIGLFNAEAQPVQTADGRVTVFFCGEIYNRAALRAGLERLRVTAGEGDAALALALFQAYGPRFAERVDGVFFAAVYDSTARRLLLTNDRHGLYPHYLYQAGGRLVFAPEVKGVLAAPFVPRRLNLTAVAEYTRFQQLLGRKTFHEGIERLPAALIGQYDLRTGEWIEERYWDWDHIPYRPETTFEEAVEATADALKAAVERLSAGPLRVGVFLSGGYDSRILAGLVPPSAQPFVTANFGRLDCRDVYYGGQIARALGTRHHHFDLPLNGQWVLDNLDLHLALTEGFHNWVHMHGISMLPELRGLMDVNLTGWEGGMLLGWWPDGWTFSSMPTQHDGIFSLLFDELTRGWSWPGLSEAEERMLFAPEFARRLVGAAYESLVVEFAPYRRFPHRFVPEIFYNDSASMRLTHHMITTARSHLDVRFPFWDHRLVDTVLSYPPEYRQDYRLYRHLMDRLAPRLTRIPEDKKEMLPTTNTVLRQVHHLSVRARKKLGLYPHLHTLYADYAQYLRTDLRPWAEGILFDARTRDRGLFRPEALRSLLDRHYDGREGDATLGKVAPLITLEMTLRQLFD